MAEGTVIPVPTQPDWGCGWSPPGWCGHNQAWEAKMASWDIRDKAWDTKEDASYEAFELGLAKMPWVNYDLNARLDSQAAMQKAGLDNQAAEYKAGLNQVVALSQGDVRQDIAAERSQEREIKNLAVLDFLNRGQKVDAQMAAGYNEVLLTQAWVRDDTVETAVKNNVELAKVMTLFNYPTA